ncbi:MAG: sialidase family protein, partial [Planctomycetota bacterium]
TLDPPVVQSSMLRVASKNRGDSQNILLFSGPDENGPNGKGRSDLRIRVSVDEAKTWFDGPLIYDGKAAYSDLVRLGELRVGILFEAGDGNKSYQRIVFTPLSIPADGRF